MTVKNFLKMLFFGEEVRILADDNTIVYRGYAIEIPKEYYQREIRLVFSYDLYGDYGSCTCIIIK